MNGTRRELARLKRQARSLAEELEHLETLFAETGEQTSSESEKDVITIEELADILDVHHNTIRRYIKKGRLNPYRIGNKHYFLRSELPAILATATEARKAEEV